MYVLSKIIIHLYRLTNSALFPNNISVNPPHFCLFDMLLMGYIRDQLELSLQKLLLRDVGTVSNIPDEVFSKCIFVIY